MRFPRGAFVLILLHALGCTYSRLRSGAAELIASIDLPRERDTEELSGTFYDLPSHTLYAVQDSEPEIVALLLAPDLKSLRVASTIPLQGRPSDEWDGEGLARGGDGAWWVMAVERHADLERFTPDGRYLGRVDVPARYRTPANGRMGIESLSFSPSGRHWFIASEDALVHDGPIAGPDTGTIVRILRHDVESGSEEERSYRTDRAPPATGGTLGVSDVTAVDEAHLLVLERGFALGYGNTARIYRVDFESRRDTQHRESLADHPRALRKKLVVDLRELRLRGVKNPEKEPNPLLGNYEGLALGPPLPDGRRVVFVTSDDNASASQIARVLVLAVAL